VFDGIAEAVTTTIAPVVPMEGCSVRLLERVNAAVAAGPEAVATSPTESGTR
jgi:hypothetical protein